MLLAFSPDILYEDWNQRPVLNYSSDTFQASYSIIESYMQIHADYEASCRWVKED